MPAIKGNVVIGQSGGPTAVINQSLVALITEAEKHKEIQEIYGARFGILGILGEDFIDLRQQSRETLSHLAHMPGAALGSCRHKPTEEDCEKVFEVFFKHNVRYFFYIGGNDSALAAAIVNRIARKRNYELRIFHVPKTIDNDLLVTDHCPGYGSGARYIALAFMGDDLDNRSLPGIKINICMGRDAGWLTAASTLARQNEDDGPHLIYIPERPRGIKQFVEEVEAVYEQRGRVLIAVSEGLRGPDGEILIQSQVVRKEIEALGMGVLGEVLKDMEKVEQATGGAKVDAFGNIQLSGIGTLDDLLASALKIWFYRKHKKKVRVRADILGYPQRSFMGVTSEVDVREAQMVGREAVRYAMRGDIDGSIVLHRIGKGENYDSEVYLAELEKVAGIGKPKEEQFRAMSDEFINEAGNDVTPLFRDYALPLVGTLPQKVYFKEVERAKK